jgi:hypothetical protein
MLAPSATALVSSARPTGPAFLAMIAVAPRKAQYSRKKGESMADSPVIGWISHRHTPVCWPQNPNGVLPYTWGSV